MLPWKVINVSFALQSYAFVNKIRGHVAMETQQCVLFSVVAETKTLRNVYTSGYRNNLTPFPTKTAIL
jgi:hypothetical protein